MLRIPKLAFLFVLVGLFAFACSKEPADDAGALEETPIVDVAAEEAALQALGDSYVQAVAAKDIDTLVNFWTEDVVGIAHDGTTMTGHEAIRASYTEQFSAEGSPSMEIVPERRAVASSGDLAYEIGTYTMTMTGADGAATSSSYRYVVGYQKIDGAWKVDFSMDSAPLPAAEAAPATAEAPAE